jgi:hypothetical protein
MVSEPALKIEIPFDDLSETGRSPGLSGHQAVDIRTYVRLP